MYAYQMARRSVASFVWRVNPASTLDYALDTQIKELLQLCVSHSIVSRP